MFRRPWLQRAESFRGHRDAALKYHTCAAGRLSTLENQQGDDIASCNLCYSRHLHFSGVTGTDPGVTGTDPEEIEKIVP